jgi:hypothetical protein
VQSFDREGDRLNFIEGGGEHTFMDGDAAGGALSPNTGGGIFTGTLTCELALPEIVHVFSKRDRMGYEGFKRFREIVNGLKAEGLISRAFFVSAVEQNLGMAELKQYILDYP